MGFFSGVCVPQSLPIGTYAASVRLCQPFWDVYVSLFGSTAGFLLRGLNRCLCSSSRGRVPSMPFGPA